ncbi:MAG: sulfatase-like hydrolase/transferase, partial [Clostridia bacterium]|nr:sulfatase-like hydrolase/transferase [Clostridia bacterium]
MKKRNKVVREGVGVRFPISPSLFALIESTILAFILEILSRRSFVSAVEFVFQKPHVFLFNVIIVALSLVLALLFRKKVFALTLVTTIWLGFGIANCVLLSFRTASPLTSVDLQLGLEAIQMVNIYFEWWQLVLIVIGVVFAIALLLIVAIRSPKFRKEGQHAYLRLTSCLVVFLLALFTLTNIGHVSTNLRPSLYDAYLEYGFPYCFSYSFFDIGINKPKYYSGREVQYISDEIDIEVEIDHEVDEVTTFFDEIIETVEIGAFKEKPPEYTVDAIEAIRDTLAKKAAEKERSAEDYPNIIFVQLESFFDPMTIKHLTFSEDPIPVFRSLKDGNTSGKLNVPTVAGGTANTEFEVLTGCCLDFFGAGEFPYYSILREKAVESLATDLRINGYTATGIHNYTGSFYYRNDVYQNLGFNNFVSIEYMDGYEKTLTQWPKDEILKDVMKDAIRLTEGKDFIYTITVQTHGKYIEIPEEMAPVITVEGARSEEEKNVMEFYLAMLTEVDKLIGDIIREYEDFEEDTIIVFFGDHLPGLDLTNDDLTTGDI